MSEVVYKTFQEMLNRQNQLDGELANIEAQIEKKEMAYLCAYN